MASIIQRANGDWRARIARAGHAYTSKVFTLKKDAEDWVRKIETKQDTGSVFSPKEAKAMTVAYLLNRYLVEVTPHKKSVKFEKNCIGRLLKCDFANRKLNQIKQIDIQAWRDARLKEITSQSVGREMTTISAVFSHAMSEWQMPFLQNPVKLVKRPSNSGKFRNQRFTDEQIEAILKASNWDEKVQPKTSLDHFPWVFIIAIESAMRTGELAGLKVADFFPNERYVCLRDTKNGDDRNVPLTSKAVKYLTFITKNKKPTDRIFQMTAGTIGVYFRDTLKIAKLSKEDGYDFHFHDTRHEGTTRLSEKLPNTLELGAVTGHRSFRCLQRYYNPNITTLAQKLG